SVGGRQAVERAVGENRSAVFGLAGLVATGYQCILQGARALAEFAPVLACDPGQCLANRLSGAVGLLNGRGQQAAGEVIVTFRNGDKDLVGCTTVELRRSPGAGAGLATQPFELDREYAVVDEAV